MINSLRRLPGKTILKQYAPFFAVLVLLTILTTLFEMLSIGAVAPLVNVIIQDGAAAQSYGPIVDQIHAFLNSFSGYNPFVVLSVFFLGATILKIVFKSARDILRTLLTQKVVADSQKVMYEKSIHSDLSYFIRNKSGELIFRIINLPREVSAYFKFLPSIFVETLNILILCILLLTVSPLLFTGVVVIGIFFHFGVRALSRNVFEKIGQEIPKVTSRQNIIANETIGGIREIVTYGKEAGWLERFRAQCDRYYRLRTKVVILKLLPGNILELVIIGGMCLLGVYYGLNSMERLYDAVPVLAVYAMALLRMIPS